MTESRKPQRDARKKQKPAHLKPIKEPTPKQQAIITTVNNHPNLSTYQVAKICETDHSYVVQIMQRYGITHNLIHDYKSNRADIFAGLQHRLLQSITDEDIKKAPIGSRVLAAAQIYDKERLERGESTQNLHQIVDVISRIQAQVRGDAVDKSSCQPTNELLITPPTNEIKGLPTK